MHRPGNRAFHGLGATKAQRIRAFVVSAISTPIRPRARRGRAKSLHAEAGSCGGSSRRTASSSRDGRRPGGLVVECATMNTARFKADLGHFVGVCCGARQVTFDFDLVPIRPTTSRSSDGRPEKGRVAQAPAGAFRGEALRSCPPLRTRPSTPSRGRLREARSPGFAGQDVGARLDPTPHSGDQLM